MESKIYLPNGTEAQMADYHDSPIEEFHNPLIQALPSTVTDAGIVQKLMSMPPFDPSERELDSEVRVYILQRLFDVFQPLPIHLRIWKMVYSLLLQGYVARNPFDKNYKRFVNETGKRIIEWKYNMDVSPHFRSTALAGTLIGVSGMGKTTTVNHVLRHIPQVIVHNEYERKHFDQIQLVWLKLEAPFNSSVKALCIQYFTKLDDILGTNNFKKLISRNLSVDAMIPYISQTSRNVALGVLIIDESQYIAKRGNQLIDFLVSLINGGLSILLVGTPASYGIFEDEFRIARRLSGSKEVLWNPMKNNEEFRLFLQGIWRFQWTKSYTPLSNELKLVMFEETQGISDLVIKLFIYVQQFSIEHQVEAIAPELIRRVAKDNFKLMKPMLDALRSNNPYKISQFSDLRILDEKVQKTSSSSQVSSNHRKTSVAKQSSKPVAPSPTMTKPKRNADYGVDDLRRRFRDAKKEGVLPETVLENNGYIDDMTFWIDGGNK